VLLPRASGTARFAGGRLTFGAGRFVDEWAAEALLPLRARAAAGIEHFALDGSCVETADPTCGALRGTTDEEIARQRQTVASIGLTRTARRLDLASEYRWSASTRVPSLARSLSDAGWLETFGSRGRQRLHEIRARAGAGPRARSFVAHYAWRRARETTDGWYGSPVNLVNLDQWVPAANIPTHEGGLVFSMRSRGGTSVSAVGSFTSGRPVDVVLSPQSLAEVLTEPRRPGLRNAGIGPRYASVSLYASRRVGIPFTAARGRLGMQVVNLLGRKNLLAPVTVVDSPLYGRATSAGPGRALAMWFALERGR
jgi:hypothetical protein